VPKLQAGFQYALQEKRFHRSPTSLSTKAVLKARAIAMPDKLMVELHNIKHENET